MKLLDIKETQGILKDILNEVDVFCRENNLTYFLAYGSLIGAIRHKGFIPWDDDIDICMPRPDYERFIHSFSSKNQKYSIGSHVVDEKFPYFFAKVQDESTFLETKLTFNYTTGLYIDIFPIDGIPNEKKLQKNYIRKFHFYRHIYNLKSITYRKDRNPFKNLFLMVSRAVTAFIPTKVLVKKIDKINQSYNYSETQLVSIAATTDKRLILDKGLFAAGLKLEFEGLLFNVPSGYHEILERNYGNYMKLPPIGKRLSTHKIKAYLKD